MTTSTHKSGKPVRCGFSKHCAIQSHGFAPNTFWTAMWKGSFARERDGTQREFPTESLARAWLAAADATNGESFRHQCS